MDTIVRYARKGSHAYAEVVRDCISGPLAVSCECWLHGYDTQTVGLIEDEQSARDLADAYICEVG